MIENVEDHIRYLFKLEKIDREICKFLEETIVAPRRREWRDYEKFRQKEIKNIRKKVDALPGGDFYVSVSRDGRSIKIIDKISKKECGKIDLNLPPAPIIKGVEQIKEKIRLSELLGSKQSDKKLNEIFLTEGYYGLAVSIICEKYTNVIIKED